MPCNMDLTSSSRRIQEFALLGVFERRHWRVAKWPTASSEGVKVATWPTTQHVLAVRAFYSPSHLPFSVTSSSSDLVRARGRVSGAVSVSA